MAITKTVDAATLGGAVLAFFDAIPHVAAGFAAVLAAVWWGIRVYREWRAARRGDPL